MPLTPPFPIKTYPDAEVAPLPPVTVVRQPVMSISYDGCLGDATLTLDRMPTMNREPEALPDIPGGGFSYTGTNLEYLDMGIAPANSLPVQWSGRGASFWDVYVDGYVLGTIGPNVFDGDIGPFTVGLPSELNWKLPHTFWVQATYEDRPGYRDFYMGTGVGVVAYGPGSVVCPCAFCPSIGWDRAEYWDPWVVAHHDVADTSGPVDRHGNYLGLTGPWGASVPKQHLSTDPTVPLCLSVGVPDGSSFAATLTDLVYGQDYDAVSYVVESSHQQLTPCTDRSANPVFRTLHHASA